MNFYYVSGSMGFKTLRYQYCYFRMTEEDTNVQRDLEEFDICETSPCLQIERSRHGF